MFVVKVSEGCRVVIPAAIRRRLNVADGDTVIWQLHASEVRLSTRKSLLHQARSLVQKTIPAGSAPELVDELLQDRRKVGYRSS